MMLQTLQSGCDAVVGNGNCNAIPTGDYTVTVDYTGVRNLAFCYSLNESGLWGAVWCIEAWKCVSTTGFV